MRISLKGNLINSPLPSLESLCQTTQRWRNVSPASEIQCRHCVSVMSSLPNHHTMRTGAVTVVLTRRGHFVQDFFTSGQNTKYYDCEECNCGIWTASMASASVQRGIPNTMSPDTSRPRNAFSYWEFNLLFELSPSNCQWFNLAGSGTVLPSCDQNVVSVT